MPIALGDQFFRDDDWRLIRDPRIPATAAGSHNDPDSGFAATLFQRGTIGEKVLFIHGAEPKGNQFYLNLLKADISQIGLLGKAISQTVSFSLTFTNGGTTSIDEYTLARDTADTRFLQWVEEPESVAAGPHLNLGGVQMNLQQALARDAGEGYLGRPAGTLRAKLNAYANEADIVSPSECIKNLLDNSLAEGH